MSQSSEQPKIDDLKRLLKRLEQVSPDKEIVVRPSTSAAGEGGGETSPVMAAPALTASPPALAQLTSVGAGASSKAEPMRITPPPLPPPQQMAALMATAPAPVPVRPAERAGMRVPIVFASAAALSVAAAVGLWAVRDRFASPAMSGPHAPGVASRPAAMDTAAAMKAETNAQRTPQAIAQSIVAAVPSPAAVARGDEPRLVNPPQLVTPPVAAAPAPAPAPATAATSEPPQGATWAQSPVMRAQPSTAGRDKFESEARLDVYLERGQKLVEEGDLTAARAFFRRAAESGDPRGALALGMTYDINYFAELGIRGVPADSAAAGEWYRKAMDLGSKDALDRLERLPQQ